MITYLYDFIWLYVYCVYINVYNNHMLYIYVITYLIIYIYIYDYTMSLLHVAANTCPFIYILGY